jgi:hypothetical protein
MATARKSVASTRSSRAAHARAEDDARRIEHAQKSLKAVQEDLASIGGRLGTGVRDLRAAGARRTA